MTERPILFSAPMVVAIIHGLKGQTRRVVKPQPKAAYVTFMPISTEIVGLTKHGGDVDKRGYLTDHDENCELHKAIKKELYNGN